MQFLVHEKTFAEDRVRKAIDRIAAAKGKASQVGRWVIGWVLAWWVLRGRVLRR